MFLSEALAQAIGDTPPGGEATLLVKIIDLSNSASPGRQMEGVLPIVVVGALGMDKLAWARWVRDNAIAHYGPAMAERFVTDGVDLKEMDPTRPFGRSMRLREDGTRSTASKFYSLDDALFCLKLVEKWPSLYNLIATEMSGEEMSIQEFVSRVYTLPSPAEVGEGRSMTLGDLVAKTVVRTPNF